MNNIVQNQECNIPIKEAVAIVFIIGSFILLTYGLVDILRDGYHIYFDGLSISDQPMLFSVLIKAICHWLLAAVNYFMVIPWLLKQP